MHQKAQLTLFACDKWKDSTLHLFFIHKKSGTYIWTERSCWHNRMNLKNFLPVTRESGRLKRNNSIPEPLLSWCRACASLFLRRHRALTRAACTLLILRSKSIHFIVLSGLTSTFNWISTFYDESSFENQYANQYLRVQKVQPRCWKRRNVADTCYWRGTRTSQWGLTNLISAFLLLMGEICADNLFLY